jgi:hypothetical protein
MISNEKFLKNNKAITNLKLKASWGKTGMKDIGASKYLEAFAYSTQYNNYSSAVPTQMSNPNLKWEQTTQTNAGFEIGLFNRVSLDLNYYYNITKDLLVFRDLSPSGGFSAQWQNLGSVVNTGFEAALSVTPVQTKDFTWNIDFSIAYNKNWLFDFGDTEIYSSDYSGVTQVYKNGYELYTWYLKEYAGIDPATGREQFYDNNGDLTYDYASARYITAGSALTPWEGGLATYVNYKNFKLSATLILSGNMLYAETCKAPGNHRRHSDSSSNDDVIASRAMCSQWAFRLSAAATNHRQPGPVIISSRNVPYLYFPKNIMKKCGLTLRSLVTTCFTSHTVWGAI